MARIKVHGKTKKHFMIDDVLFRSTASRVSLIDGDSSPDDKKRQEMVALIIDCVTLCGDRVEKLSPGEREWIRDGRLKIIGGIGR